MIICGLKIGIIKQYHITCISYYMCLKIQTFTATNCLSHIQYMTHALAVLIWYRRILYSLYDKRKSTDFVVKKKELFFTNDSDR